MQESFPGYYNLSESEYADLWKYGIFVLDANVLLNLYRYSEPVREEMFAVFSSISSRLWLPHQAALEYQNNRLNAIADQVKRFCDVKKLIQDAHDSLAKSLANLQLEKRHSSIRTDQVVSEIGRSIDEFVNQLTKSEASQFDVMDPDPIRDAIDRILTGRIGPAPPSQAWLDDVYAEGKRRYGVQQPPGFEDTKKQDSDPKSYTSAGLVYERQYGDLILWKELISHTSSLAEPRYIILVTDDQKSDWWWRVESQGWKTVGPRPELIEEIQRQGHVKSFWMYTSDRFLEYARKYLRASVSNASMEQVRDVAARSHQSRSIRPTPEKTLDAVRRWLELSDPYADVLRPKSGFPDLVVRGASGKVGYEIVSISDPLRAVWKMRQALKRLGDPFEAIEFSAFYIVVTGHSTGQLNSLSQVITQNARPTAIGTPEIRVVTGILVPDAENGALTFVESGGAPDTEAM